MKVTLREFFYVKVTELRQQFETKLRGLMPICVRNELEDTIASLRSQVSSLQQRCIVLEEEVDLGRKLGSTGALRHSVALSACGSSTVPSINA